MSHYLESIKNRRTYQRRTTMIYPCCK